MGLDHCFPALARFIEAQRAAVLIHSVKCQLMNYCICPYRLEAPHFHLDQPSRCHTTTQERWSEGSTTLCCASTAAELGLQTCFARLMPLPLCPCRKLFFLRAIGPLFVAVLGIAIVNIFNLECNTTKSATNKDPLCFHHIRVVGVHPGMNSHSLHSLMLQRLTYISSDTAFLAQQALRGSCVQLWPSIGCQYSRAKTALELEQTYAPHVPGCTSIPALTTHGTHNTHLYRLARSPRVCPMRQPHGGSPCPSSVRSWATPWSSA